MSGLASFLQPSQELVDQSREFAKAWIDFENVNEPRNKNEGGLKLDKPFYH